MLRKIPNCQVTKARIATVIDPDEVKQIEQVQRLLKTVIEERRQARKFGRKLLCYIGFHKPIQYKGQRACLKCQRLL